MSGSILDGLWVIRIRNTPNFLPSMAILESTLYVNVLLPLPGANLCASSTTTTTG
ncbi:MAG: hypothetical protein RXQ57_05295 [Caldivirga sp.]